MNFPARLTAVQSTRGMATIRISTKADGCYSDVNDSSLALMKYERSLVVGHTMAELAIWVDPQDRITMMRRLSEQGKVIGLPAQIRASTGIVLGLRGEELGSAVGSFGQTARKEVRQLGRVERQFEADYLAELRGRRRLIGLCVGQGCVCRLLGQIGVEIGRKSLFVVQRVQERFPAIEHDRT